MQKTAIILFVGTLLLMEAYNFFPKGVYLHLFWAKPDKTESIRWFVTAIADRVVWIATMWVFWRFLRTLRPSAAQYFFIFVLYRCLDLVAYILNGSISGKFYLIVYTPIVIYVLFLLYNRKVWTAAEWLYSKITRNGNTR